MWSIYCILCQFQHRGVIEPLPTLDTWYITYTIPWRQFSWFQRAWSIFQNSFRLHGWTLILRWLSSWVEKWWVEITCPFQKLDNWDWLSHFIIHITVNLNTSMHCSYILMCNIRWWISIFRRLLPNRLKYVPLRAPLVPSIRSAFWE